MESFYFLSLSQFYIIVLPSLGLAVYLLTPVSVGCGSLWFLGVGEGVGGALVAVWGSIFASAVGLGGGGADVRGGAAGGWVEAGGACQLGFGGGFFRSACLGVLPAGTVLCPAPGSLGTLSGGSGPVLLGLFSGALVVLAGALPGLWVCSLSLDSCDAVGSSSWVLPGWDQVVLSGLCWVFARAPVTGGDLPASFWLGTQVPTASWSLLYVAST